MREEKTVFEARSWSKIRKWPTRWTRGQNYGFRHQKMAGICISGGDTVTRSFPLWNSPGALNTSEFEYLTWSCDYLPLVASLSRMCGRTGEPLSCDLEVCPVELEVKMEVLKDSQLGWGRVGSRYRNKRSHQWLDIIPLGSPERLWKHGHDMSIIALRNISLIVSWKMNGKDWWRGNRKWVF